VSLKPISVETAVSMTGAVTMTAMTAACMPDFALAGDAAVPNRRARVTPTKRDALQSQGARKSDIIWRVCLRNRSARLRG
jgi:hypothetical protein